MKVTFLGHRNTPERVRKILEPVLKNLIEEGADDFYVGNQGNFDSIAWSVLGGLKREYPNIERTLVLAYMPRERILGAPEGETLFPEAVATAPPRFAICKRNDWMLKGCDTVITYVTHSRGGAVQFKEKAEKLDKRVIELSAFLKSE